jgi:predicted acetyltransferase
MRNIQWPSAQTCERLADVAGLELREVPAAEAREFARALELAFGSAAIDDEQLDTTARLTYDPGWAIGFYDGGRLVSTASALNLEVTVPAGPGRPCSSVAVPGVTAVGVLPTHRRRGLLKQMMAYQLGQFRDREAPFAILTASESLIYGRFGYGLASSCQSLAIATKRSSFLGAKDAEEPGPGRMRLVNLDEARTVLPAIHDRARRLRPGEISRPASTWETMLRDPERSRDDDKPRTFVVHEGANGGLDGYASYRYHSKWEDGLPANRVAVEDLYSTSPRTHAALWRFLLDIDLVEEVTAWARPLDEALRWLLAEPRRLRTTGMYDSLWALIVDVPAALAVRGYGIETELVLEITGPSTDRFRVTTGIDGGYCEPAKDDEQTDLVLGLSQLGAIYLGGCRPSVLAAAGLVEETRAGALARADAAFASPLLPFCGTGF